MKISVITVCFNSEKTIENTIKSVINQSYKNIEYVIIDGGSTDNTKKLINKYKNNISIIKSETDKGIYDALNKGIALSSGEIISILHSNDMFYNEETLTKVNKYFHNHPDLKVLLSGIAFKKNFGDERITRYYSSNFFKPWMLKFGFSPPHTSSFITKETYEKVGFYDTSFKIAGDFEFFVKCFLKERISYIISNQCSVIMSSGGLSGKNFNSYLISSLEINKALKKNNYYSNILLTFLRFPFKLIQFLIK
jgi:glycosyltransferase involved in cell wall biosynthesis